MNNRRSRSELSRSFGVEALEGRVVLSTVGSMPHVAVEVGAQSFRKAITQTTLLVGSGAIGQPITFSATVRATASAGSPSGTVKIIDRGLVIATLTLSPTASTGGKYAFSGASVTLPQAVGGNSYYFGRHQVSAEFVPNGGGFVQSTAVRNFNVGQPTYTQLANGVEYATTKPGTGAPVRAGQTANVQYTGYLAPTGQVFDDSLTHGGSPLSFTVGAGQVVPGFDAGTAGMQVGESRVIVIPASQGYGATANGSIPANSTLVFLVTLQSIA